MWPGPGIAPRRPEAAVHAIDARKISAASLTREIAAR
jgi:hypothetical protein